MMREFNATGVYIGCTIHARPVLEGKASDGLLLVVLEDRPASSLPNHSAAALASAPTASDSPLRRLYAGTNCSKAN